MITAKLQLLQETFESKFDIDKFKTFTREFFNEPEMLSGKRHTGIWREYENSIISYSDIAKFKDSEGNNIIIFAVELKSEKGVEKARSLQRNFISKILDDKNSEAAIVAFYSETDVNWRLSFVRLDYTFKDKGLELDLTPAKRYSYLVGENETSHTAQKQLYPIFENDKNNPTLDEIEAAFSVEKVTKDFFEQYKNKYYDLKEYLEKDEAFINETLKLGFQVDKFSEQFSKKLMGQLAFLYFIQKKGWLGVRIIPEDHSIEKSKFIKLYNEVDDTHKEILKKLFLQSKDGTMKLSSRLFHSITDKEIDLFSDCFVRTEFNMPWGSGDKRFIRGIFDFCVNNTNKNFFDDYLEPLFYDALNKRRNNQYFKLFNCKIPFLNGGLFEPLEGYHWKEAKFEIPDKIFSNVKEKGREADGILDIFDRYNFTMNEDEPLEKEVAVDPEMLGKIFENLLDGKDRKAKGAFYTPREIVHYMCQESLTNYLVNEVDVPYEDMKQFILYGELIRDADNRSGIANSRNFNDKKTIKQSIFDKIVLIEEALINIRVADPAVGSGAFPLGMLNEIVRARNNITEYLVRLDKSNKLDRKYGEAYIRKSRSQYMMKWKTIKNCIFAVDIEPSAVDIAKLRLWLSVVVEQEIDEDNLEPHPLPNLDCNIMVGNSLIDEYEGIKLFDETLLHKYKNNNPKEASETHSKIASTMQLSMLIDYSDQWIKEMFELQDKLFEEDEEHKKKEIKDRIDKIRDQLIEYKLNRDGNKEGLNKYNEMKKLKMKPFFIWKLEFAKVFKEKGGFDVVVGNPPYVKVQNLSHEIIDTLKERWKTAWKRIDISTLFIELGYSIINSIGSVNYISSNQFLTTEYGRKMREFLLENHAIRKMLDFGDLPLFENAITYVGIFFLGKNQNGEFKYNRVRKLPFIAPENFDNIDTKCLSGETWSLGASELSQTMTKIENITSHKLSSFAKAWYGIITGKDNLLMFDIEDDPKIEDEMLLPVIRSQGCGRYCFASPSKKVVYPYFLNNEDTLIYTLEELKANYQNTYNYIMENQKELKERKDSRNTFGQRTGWYGLVRFGQISTFSKSKIVTPGEVKHNKFGLDLTKSGFTGARVFSITVEDEKLDIKYLLALLNSKVIEFYLHHIASLKQGGYYSYSTTVLERIPIIISNNQTEYVKLVNEIMCKKTRGEDTTVLEEQIDKLVYELYNLDEKDIDIIIQDLGGC